MSHSVTAPEKHPKPMLGELNRIHRNLHRYGLRGMAKQIGISHATLARVEEGKNVDGYTIIKLFHWLFGDAAWALILVRKDKLEELQNMLVVMASQKIGGMATATSQFDASQYLRVFDEMMNSGTSWKVREMEDLDDEQPERGVLCCVVEDGRIKSCQIGIWNKKYSAWQKPNCVFLDNSFLYPTHWVPLPDAA